MKQLAFLLPLLPFVCLGCAGAPASNNPTPEPETTSTPDPETKPETKPEAESDGGESTSENPEDEKPREVRYILAGGKLEVETNGVRFKPSVKAVKVGGGWGLKLMVQAEVVDGEQHVLLKPDEGIFAFAGEITRKGKEPERFGDERKSEGEAVVKPDEKSDFERSWPDAGGKPLAKGDKLKLEVGLWGLGNDKKSRRPVKKFLIVSMNAEKATPTPVVLPPE
jgi:hypothetical protein